MLKELVAEATPKMLKTYEHLADELKAIRTSRASASLVENIKVTYYEQEMTVKQLANISTPDGKTITITVWDAAACEPIEKAIREDKNLDFNPISDGKTIHISVPPLTQERRQQIAKQVNEKVEAAHISLRNIRHDILNELKKLQKNSQISEDDYRWAEKELTAKLNEFRDKIDEVAEHKRQEVLSV